MTARDEFLLRRFRNALFHRHIARNHGVRKRRRREASGLPPWSFDGLLHVHAEIDHVDQSLQGDHHLVVAARTSRNHERLTVLHHERALQRAAGPLSGLKRVGLTANQRVIVATAVEDDSRISHHDSRSEQAVKAGLEAHHVAVLIDDCDVAGVAVEVRVAVENHVPGPLRNPGDKFVG